MVVGLELEAARLLRRVPAAVRGALTVRAVGPGAARLERLDAALLESRPAVVLATGLAGGCAPDLAPGDLVLGAPVGGGDREQWPDPEWRGRALRALARTGCRHRAGLLLTVDRIVASPAAKATHWRRGALAVDMESARVVAWAERAGVPALAVRAVADGAGESLPAELLGAVDADGRIRCGAAAALLRRPALAAAGWRLQRRSRRALASLGRFVQALVDTPGEP
ncbi:MAG TPA: hypothetical protein VFC42_04100 [Methylomirabilota bacterium]|nr:hypothetical protein [Methylomirabilota bacterium]